MGVFRLKATPFREREPTPLASLIPEKRRGNYTIIKEDPKVIPPRPQVVRPMAIGANYFGRPDTPAMRKARMLWRKQQRRVADPPPPPPTSKRQPRPDQRPRLKPGLHNGTVPREYAGRHAVVFATGPSLTEEVVELIRPYHEDGTVVTFGCNDAFRIVPYLDVSYACDPPWMNYAVTNNGWLDHPCEKWTCDRQMAPMFGLNWINGKSGPGLSENQQVINYGGNSGYQVLNLAWLYGCVTFLLVGYNMGKPHGKTHFFGDHPSPMSRGTSFPTFIQAFQTIRGQQAQQIFNCTKESSLPCFQHSNLKEMLELCRSLSLDSGQAKPPWLLEPDPA